MEHARVQLFAWDAHNKGVDVHPLGEPTRLEVLRKEFVGKKEEFKQKGQEGLIQKLAGWCLGGSLIFNRYPFPPHAWQLRQ